MWEAETEGMEHQQRRGAVLGLEIGNNLRQNVSISSFIFQFSSISVLQCVCVLAKVTYVMTVVITGSASPSFMSFNNAALWMSDLKIISDLNVSQHHEEVSECFSGCVSPGWSIKCQACADSLHCKGDDLLKKTVLFIKPVNLSGDKVNGNQH